jgi:hypothetical protein
MNQLESNFTVVRTYFTLASRERRVKGVVGATRASFLKVRQVPPSVPVGRRTSRRHLTAVFTNLDPVHLDYAISSFPPFFAPRDKAGEPRIPRRGTVRSGALAHDIEWRPFLISLKVGWGQC